MGMCAALVKGANKECQAAVPEGAPIKLCLLHALLAHQWVVEMGGAHAVAGKIREARR